MNKTYREKGYYSAVRKINKIAEPVKETSSNNQ